MKGLPATVESNCPQIKAMSHGISAEIDFGGRPALDAQGSAVKLIGMGEAAVARNLEATAVVKCNRGKSRPGWLSRDEV